WVREGRSYGSVAEVRRPGLGEWLALDVTNTADELLVMNSSFIIRISLESGHEVERLRRPEGLHQPRYSCDGSWIFGAGSKRVYFWQRATGESWHRSVAGATPVDVSPDGRLAAFSADAGETVSLVELETGDEVANLQGHAKRLEAVAFAADGRRVAT